jgi:leucyl aminopeptidase
MHRTPELSLTSCPSSEIASDLLVIPVFEDDALADEPGLDAASGGEVGRARERGALKGQLYDAATFWVGSTGWATRRAVLVGAGRRADLDGLRLRRLATVGAIAARDNRVTRLAIVHRCDTPLAPEAATRTIAEGVILANYDGAAYKSDPKPRPWIEHAQLRVAGGSGAALERACVLGECTNEARELANEPSNELTPRRFADRAAEIAGAAGLGIDVLDEHRIAALGMGLLLGVARGSQEPPRVVALRYEPEAAAPGVVLGLVGKGITFDTGGISIKPADNMDKMKDDMAGGAAVVCAMAAIARLRASVRVVAVVPMTENMPGGRAIKPGDVLRSAAGTTVEVLNTDAEGRLILGDGVWYARELGATHLVDIATLTGACVVALGKLTSGLFGAPEAWVDQVRQAGDRAGDRLWPMPVFEDYKEQLKSEIADLTNTGGRPAGAITGALFIKEFAGGRPWAHIDIAGTAWAEDAKPFQPKGATGVGVRTLAELALEAQAWSKLEM